MKKICRDCGQEKELDEFQAHQINNKIYYGSYCRPCSRLRSQNDRTRRNLLDPEKAKRRRRIEKLLHRYDTTVAYYEDLFKRQDGCCKICQQPETKVGLLQIDHIKGTKTIRGLLCGLCNKAIGSFDHNPKRLRAAAAYLEAHT